MRNLSNRKIASIVSLLVIVAFIVLIAAFYSPESEEDHPVLQDAPMGMDFDVGGLSDSGEDCTTESEDQDDEEEECAIWEAPSPIAQPSAEATPQESPTAI